jgi:hypothetical protein
MKNAMLGVTLAVLCALASMSVATASAASSDDAAMAAARVPVQQVVWRRGVRGYGPYGGAGVRVYNRNYGYAPYGGGAYYGGRPYEAYYRGY